MDYKILVENFRKYLKEEEKVALRQGRKSKDYEKVEGEKKTLEAMIGAEYKNFVATLKNKVKDPKFQAFLSMGLGDGSLPDDRVGVKPGSIPVKDLQPTQSQIGLADSLGYLSETAPQGASALALGQVKPANIGGRIITANGKYIVDGHHRWSQIYLINPNAKVPAINFTVKGVFDSPEGVLKLAHLSIAATDKDVPLKQADSATDVYKTGGDRNKIKNILNQTVSDEMANVLAPHYKTDSKEGVVDRIADHAQLLYKETKAAAAAGPERGFMPQTAELSPEVDKMKAIMKGAVNWNPKA